jgi:hypothetical protein
LINIGRRSAWKINHWEREREPTLFSSSLFVLSACRRLVAHLRRCLPLLQRLKWKKTAAASPLFMWRTGS